MFGTKVAWLNLVWAITWFAVIVPIHQRGQIKLDEASSGCCQQTCPTDAPAPSDQEPTDPADDCAVCFLVAHLDTPMPSLAAPAMDLKAIGDLRSFGHRIPNISDRPVECDRGPPSEV